MKGEASLDTTLTMVPPMTAHREQVELEPELIGLVRRLRQGDQAALEPLIELTQAAAYKVAMSYLQDSHASRDVLQETYLLVYRNIGKLREPAAFRSWFYRIVTSCCHRVLRSRRQEPSLDCLVESGGGPSVASPSDAIARRLAVREAFHRLREQDRSVLTLREVCQLSYDQIAAALKIPVGTVRSRLSKARQRFLDAFQTPGGQR
ncbi:MAG: sigma-70 family RNA polymerase sigma factor [Armatimonadetes bacterium]|nr:sigma-70 family RNA polymerase sigma factor [Armatimonadota bacterium]